MSWKSDPAGQGEPKDRTKLVWLGIAVLCAAMILVLWVSTVEDTTRSRARVKHILIQPRDSADRARAFAQINEIKQWLNEGKSFESIAKDYSNDPGSSFRGGDLGWVKPEELVGPVDQFIWKCEVNQISDVITTNHGYHLVLVTSRTLSDTLRYERELQKSVFGEEETGNDSGGEAP